MSKLIIWQLENLKKDISNEEQQNIQTLKKSHQEFFNNYPSHNFNKLMKITFADLIKNALILHNYYDVTKTLELYNKYASYLNSKEYLKLLLIYINEPNLKTIYNNFKEDSEKPNKYLKKIELITEQYEIEASKYFTLFNDFNNNSKMEQDLISIFKDISYDELNNILIFIIYIKTFKSFMPENLLSNKENQILFQTNIKEINYINNFMDKISLEYTTKIKELSHELKEKLKFNTKIDDLIKELKNSQEIKNIDYLMTVCPNTAIKNLVLDYVINHNKKYYQELITKITDLETNNDSNLTNLFQIYNYDYSLLNTDEKIILKKNPYSKIAEILKLCAYLTLTNIEPDIPFYSLSKLKLVIKMLNNGTLTKTFINSYKYLLRYDNNDLSFLLANINYLSTKNINIKNYPDCLNILFSPNIPNNLELLASYNLTITKTTKDINFLLEDNLNLKLDLLLELGFSFLNLDILNNSLDDIYKLNLSNILNIPFIKLKDNPKIIFNPFKSLIPLNILNELKENTYQKASLPRILEPYKENALLLNISGIKVSINRLLRNLSKLSIINNETIFYALIYNSYYNITDIEKILKNIYPEENIYSLVRK